MIAIIASFLTVTAVSAQEPTPQYRQQFKQAFAELLEDIDFSGSLLVAKGGNTILREAVNTTISNAPEMVTPNTRFAIASMSKSFTAALVLKLVDEGKLTLEQTLADLLPTFDVPYARDVTLRHLLQNRSGIPHYTDIPGWFDNAVKRAFTPRSFMAALAELQLKFAPGSDYLYSNVNYYLLALMIDRYAGMPYEAYLQAQILRPLDMADTGQIYHQPSQLAGNYLRDDDGSYEIIPVTNPALFRGTAAMYSTIDDLRKWGQAINDGKIFSATARREALNPETPMAWSLGKLPVADDRAVEVQYYNGRLIGHLSLIMLLPEEDGVIVVLNNNTVGYNNMLGIASALAAQYFAVTH